MTTLEGVRGLPSYRGAWCNNCSNGDNSPHIWTVSSRRHSWCSSRLYTPKVLETVVWVCVRVVHTSGHLAKSCIKNACLSNSVLLSYPNCQTQPDIKSHCTQLLSEWQSLLYIPYHQNPIFLVLCCAGLISIPDGSGGGRYNGFLTVSFHLQREVQRGAKLSTH